MPNLMMDASERGAGNSKKVERLLETEIRASTEPNRRIGDFGLFVVQCVMHRCFRIGPSRCLRGPLVAE
jgi:hypothetical protein